MTPTPEPMRDAPDRPARDVSRCECCGRNTVIAVEGLFRYPQPGSPRRFCSPACRQAAYRRRRPPPPPPPPPPHPPPPPPPKRRGWRAPPPPRRGGKRTPPPPIDPPTENG